MSLISKVYPNLLANISQGRYLVQRAILCPTNDDVNLINDQVMAMIADSGRESREYFSADSILDQDDNMAMLYPTEFLYTIKASSLAPHRLVLTIGCPVMLLRNLRPQDGLCNGTRLICRSFHNFVIGAEIITGTHASNHVFVPRIPLSPSDLDMPFTMRRLQFPIRPAFAMTINKSQGQTLDTVGIYLRNPDFTHGQLYIALSRVTSRDNVHVLIQKEQHDSTPDGFTKNVVFSEILG